MGMGYVCVFADQRNMGMSMRVEKVSVKQVRVWGWGMCVCSQTSGIWG